MNPFDALCPQCGAAHPRTELVECPHCGETKCPSCDEGDDTNCTACEGQNLSND